MLTIRTSAWVWIFALLLAWSCGEDDTTPTPEADASGEQSDTGDVSAVDVTDQGGSGTVIPQNACESGQAECTDDQECIGGGCVDPVSDPDTYAADAAARPSSYFWVVQLPESLKPPIYCCFDYTGDGRVDNLLGTILGLVSQAINQSSPEEVDLAQELANGFALDELNMVVDYTQLPESGDGDVRLSVFEGTNDVDGDGEPDDTYHARIAGNGSHLIERSSVGDHGSDVQFNNATIADGVLSGGPSLFNLTVPIRGLAPLELTMQAVQVEAEVEITESGVFTVDNWSDASVSNTSCTQSGGCQEYTFCDPVENACREVIAGGRMGGVVAAGDIISEFNDQLLSCTCANVVVSADDENFDTACDGPGGTSDENGDGIPDACNVVTWGVNEEYGIFEVACSSNVGDDADGCGEDDLMICHFIDSVCAFFPSVSMLLDIDLDEDGITDALSVGLLFGLAGAEIVGATDE